MEKLEYFNQMHIRNKFEGPNTTSAWRSMLIDHLPSSLHGTITNYNEEKMMKIKDLMRVRIHFYKDIMKHSYFFSEPEY